jgi:hypothetical protein
MPVNKIPKLKERMALNHTYLSCHTRRRGGGGDKLAVFYDTLI